MTHMVTSSRLLLFSVSLFYLSKEINKLLKDFFFPHILLKANDLNVISGFISLSFQSDTHSIHTSILNLHGFPRSQAKLSDEMNETCNTIGVITQEVDLQILVIASMVLTAQSA